MLIFNRSVTSKMVNLEIWRCDQQYQRPFEDQQIYHEQKNLHQKFLLLTQLDREVHRKLNNYIEAQIVVDILTSIFQENHKFCYAPSFVRFYRKLVVVILGSSFSNLLWSFFMNCYNFSKFKFTRKDSCRKERLNVLVICNEI